MLNYRHSEPYCLLKNLKDIPREDDNIAIRWSKAAMKGGFLGSLFGYLWFVGSNTGPFEMSKLLASVGNRQYSGKTYRLMKNVLGKYALGGAAVFLSYDLIHYWLRHHDEANSRTRFMDHQIATTLIGGTAGALMFKHPLHIFCSFFFSFALVGPSAWWIKS
jgi:hypothetical protein